MYSRGVQSVKYKWHTVLLTRWYAYTRSYPGLSQSAAIITLHWPVLLASSCRWMHGIGLETRHTQASHVAGRWQQCTATKYTFLCAVCWFQT